MLRQFLAHGDKMKIMPKNMMTLVLPVFLASCGTTSKNEGSPADPQQDPSTEIWRGSCAEQPDAEVTLSLYSESHWSMSLKDGASETGNYQVGEAAAEFFKGTTILKLMTCEPVKDGVVSCLLDEVNKISFLNQCSVIKLSYVSGGPGAGEGKEGDGIPTMLPPEQPKEEEPAPKKFGDLSFSGTADCNDRSLAIKFSDDGRFSLQADGLAANIYSFVGRHFKTDKPNRYEIYSSGYLDAKGEVDVEAAAPLLCESKDGSQATGAAWTCEFTSQQDISRYKCSEFVVTIP